MTKDEIREMKHSLRLLQQELEEAVYDSDIGKGPLPALLRAGCKQYSDVLGKVLAYVEELEACLLPPGADYTVTIPVAVATNEPSGPEAYMAWIDARIHKPSNTLRFQEPIVGYGPTKEAAVLDLIRNLREANT